MTEPCKIKWQDAAENICQAAEGPVSKTVRKAAEELYETVMISMQDYLRENVEFNLSSKLQGYADTARRLQVENDALKRRSDIAEQMAAALRKAEQLYQVGLLNAPDGLADEVVNLRKAALQSYEAINAGHETESNHDQS